MNCFLSTLVWFDSCSLTKTNMPKAEETRNRKQSDGGMAAWTRMHCIASPPRSRGIACSLRVTVLRCHNDATVCECRFHCVLPAHIVDSLSGPSFFVLTVVTILASELQFWCCRTRHLILLCRHHANQSAIGFSPSQRELFLLLAPVCGSSNSHHCHCSHGDVYDSLPCWSGEQIRRRMNKAAPINLLLNNLRRSCSRPSRRCRWCCHTEGNVGVFRNHWCRVTAAFSLHDILLKTAAFTRAESFKEYSDNVTAGCQWRLQ